MIAASESDPFEEAGIAESLLEALGDLPDVTVRPSEEDSGFDYRIDLEVEGRPYTLLVEIKRSLYPRDVRDILWQLRYSKFVSWDQSRFIPFLAAGSISPGAKDILKAERVGYYDTGGSLYLPAPGAYVYIDKPAPKSADKKLQSLFKGKQAQVLHVLLMNPETWFGVHELADLARVSPATASVALSMLAQLDWAQARGQGPSKERRLVEPGAALDTWRDHLVASRRGIPTRRYYVPGRDAFGLLEELADLCEQFGVEYAVTQEAAAQNYAPYLTSIARIACRMAPVRDAQEVMSRLDARVVTEGANLEVIETRPVGEFLFKESKAGIWFASPIQTYLDLQRASGRTPELAAHLRSERIGF